MSNCVLVVNAVTELFVKQGPTAVDRWLGPTYTQHSTLAADGLDGLSGLASNLPEGFAYEPIWVLADGDLVAGHSIYQSFGPDLGHHPAGSCRAALQQRVVLAVAARIDADRFASSPVNELISS